MGTRIMTMQEFMDEFCAKELEEIARKKAVIQNFKFTYDAVIEINNEMVPVIYDDEGTALPVEKILYNKREEFAKEYPKKASLEMYDRYIEDFTIYEGEEVLKVMRNSLLEKQKGIDRYANIDFDNYFD